MTLSVQNLTVDAFLAGYSLTAGVLIAAGTARMLRGLLKGWFSHED